MKKIVLACVLLLFTTITHNIKSAERSPRTPSPHQLSKNPPRLPGIVKLRHEKASRQEQERRKRIIYFLNEAHYSLGHAYNAARQNIPDEDRQEKHACLIKFLDNAAKTVGSVAIDLAIEENYISVETKKPENAIKAIIVPIENNQAENLIKIDVEN